MDVAGKSTVLAAYTCTPLVTFPVGESQGRTEDQGEDGGRAGRRGIRRWNNCGVQEGWEGLSTGHQYKARRVEKYQPKASPMRRPITQKVSGTAGLKAEKIEALKNVTQMDKLNDERRHRAGDGQREFGIATRFPSRNLWDFPSSSRSFS